MSKTAHFRIPRPELGEEHRVVWQYKHRCPQAKVLGPALEDDNIDVLVFPVGQTGYTMPYEVPFDVTAVEPCHACGALLRAWFEWVPASVKGRFDEHDDGALVLPEGLILPGDDFEVVGV